jgi:hypothetical protein
VSSYRACVLVMVGGLAVVCAPAHAQSQNPKPAPAPVQAKPAPVQPKPAPAPVPQRPAAIQQLQYSNQGTAQRNHTFDGTARPAGPVAANPAPKPSMVGVPTSQFKPAVHVTPSKPPPSPTPAGSVTPSKLNPNGSPEVQKGLDSYKRPGT